MHIIKRTFGIISLAIVGLFGFVGCNKTTEEGQTMQNGIFVGYGEGRGGLITIAITVSNHIIETARVVTQSESSFAQSYIQRIINNVIEAQTTEDVNAISGATLTSNGVLTALDMAIKNSKGQNIGSTIHKDTSCDIVVIGAGGAGLCSAVKAASEGSKVIILEKRNIIGGNTNQSTGGINASETIYQKNLGIEDSRQLYFDDTMNGGYQLNDKSLVHTLVDSSANTLYWLAGFGADLSNVGIMGGSSVKRTHRPQGGTAIGPHLMKVLYDEIQKERIDLRTGNTVTNVLMANDGSVAGVTVQNSNGSTYTIHSKAVIIATGGFGANLSMVTSYRSDLQGFSTVNHIGATGDAFGWVKKFNAQLYQMNQIQTHPTVEVKNTLMITEAVRGNGAILINHGGQRFVNELNTRDKVSAAILQQTGGTAFLLFDENIRKSLASIETYAQQGLLTEGCDLAAIAKAANVAETTLKVTLNTYNGYQQSGEDKDFGRSAEQMPRSIATPPYYIVEVKPAIHHTMGGIHINSSAEVLNEEGTVVPGLFAAGEVTGGVHGGNRLGGNGVADIVVFGKIAGHSATDYVNHGFNKK